MHNLIGRLRPEQRRRAPDRVIPVLLGAPAAAGGRGTGAFLVALVIAALLFVYWRALLVIVLLVLVALVILGLVTALQGGDLSRVLLTRWPRGVG